MGEEDRKIDWMYAGVSAHVDREEYLLGRSIDSSLRHIQQDDEKKCHTRDETLVNIPGALFEEKQQAIQLDERAKLREDPLIAIRREAEERRKALLANPYRLKKLMQQQGSTRPSHSELPKRKREAKDSKAEKSSRRKHADSNGVEKLLHALKSVGVNKLQSLLQEDKISSSSSDEGLDDSRRRQDRRLRDARDDSPTNHRYADRRQSPNFQRSSHRSRGERSNDSRTDSRKFFRNSSSATIDQTRDNPRHDQIRLSDSKESRSSVAKDRVDRHHSNQLHSRLPRPAPYRRPKADHDEATAEQKLEEMGKNAEWRTEINNGRLKEAEKRNIAQTERDKIKAAQGKDFIHTTLTAAAGVSNMQQRIRSNLNNVQRTKHALDQNFAKR